MGNHIVEHLFLNTNSTGDIYVNMLEKAIEPLIIEILEDKPDVFAYLEITFQLHNILTV